jgi:phage terminase large subunit-like protein
MEDWDKCGGEVVPESLFGLRCYGGLDMSTKIDLTAFVLVFPKQTGLDVPTVLCKFYCPQDTIMQRSRSDRVHYEIWEQQGFLVATPGNVIDEEFVLRDIVAFAKDHNFMELGFDPWAATSITTKLVNDHGITCVEMRQGSKTLSEPAKSLLSAVKRHSVNHGGHPVLRWNADNLVMVSDANENVRPAKDKATDRIDGIVALIMAWGRMILQEQGDSVYEERGVTILE